MLFNSIDFAVFFPIAFLLYWILAAHKNARNIFLIIASYVFYGWWDWRFLFLIALSSLVDFLVGKAIYKANSPKRRKLLLWTSLLVNLGFLAYFKYFNFFVESFVDAFRLFGNELTSPALNIILPVGISFYTFQTLSYTIDIYRKQIEPTNDWRAFFAFVSFYPQLVAGPIERASHLLPQFSKTYKIDYQLVKSGVLLMAFGLFKKMVIADRAALYVNEIYNNPNYYDGTEYVYATLLFAFQIYCDFSGYSDIAIGAARTMGFDLMKNFDSPYFSKSLTEFWRRWHISLSTWFRDYVYIPLGGSKKGKYRTYANLFIVFLVSGLWHGAAMTFVIWGAIHGIILVLEKALYKVKQPFYHRVGLATPNYSNNLAFGLITFMVVCFAWVFFRANSLGDSLMISSGMINDFNWATVFKDKTYLIGLKANEFKVLIVSIVCLCVFEVFHKRYGIVSLLNKQGTLFRWSVYLLIVFSIVIFGVYGDRNISEFIYFQF